MRSDELHSGESRSKMKDGFTTKGNELARFKKNRDKFCLISLIKENRNKVHEVPYAPTNEKRLLSQHDCAQMLNLSENPIFGLPFDVYQ